MRRFKLNRLEDVSGISGVGVVAEGCLFTNGKVAIIWMPPWETVSVYPSLESIEAIHGHAGRTRIEWLDS
jgi:hypothetical protein